MSFIERRRILELLSSASFGDAVPAQLREISPPPLLGIVLDRSEPWWRRRACAIALTGRVADENAPSLLRLAEDADEVTELRERLLELLAVPGRPHSERLLGWLRAQENVEQPYRLAEAMLKARAALHDASAIAGLAELAADDWPHRREVGEFGLDALIQQAGVQVVLEAFQAKTVEALAFEQERAVAARLLGVRLLHRAGGDVRAALGDGSVIVAEHAAGLLSAAKGGEDELWNRVLSRAPGHVWALVVLHRRGFDVRAEWLAIGPPRVEVPGVPGDVREAIVREYAPGERETDPAWILEHAFLEPRPERDEDEVPSVDRAVRALSSAGLRPDRPVSAGDLHQQGGGTYFSIKTAEGAALVSTLGEFCTGDGRALSVLRLAGFRVIDDALGSIIFERLHVYFFGSRDPLPVRDLLFYWQD